MRGRGIVRGAGLAALVVGCAALLLSQPPQRSSRLFFLALGVLILAGAATRLARWPGGWRARLAHLDRIRLGYLAAGVSTGCMALSAYSLSRPDYLTLLSGLNQHLYGFQAFSEGQFSAGLALVAQGSPLVQTVHLVRGAAWMVLGWIALGLALKLIHRPFTGMIPARPVSLPGRVRWLPLGAGIAALGILAAANNPRLGLGGLHDDVQFILFCMGIGCVVWGMGGGGWQRPALSRREGLALAGIAALAFVLRIWNLENTVHRFVDEIPFVAAINHLDRQPGTPLLARFHELTAFPYLFPYAQSKAVDLLGHSLAAIRMVSALLGTLTVVALYALARTLFDRPTALLAALLLAVFPPHIHFSRLGLNNIADPLFGTLALVFLARGWKGGGRMDYALAGAALGLTQYFYEGGRLLYPVLVAAWLAGLSLRKRSDSSPHREREPSTPLPPGRKGRGWVIPGVWIALLVALIVAAPVYLALIGSPETVNPRMTQAGLGAEYFRHLLSSGDGALWRAQAWHVAYPLLASVYLPDTSWFYGDRYALVLPWLVPALLIGMGVALWRWRKPGALLLLLWLAGTALGLSLLVESASAPRLVVVFPALALLAALGIRSMAGLFMPSRAHRFIVVLLGVLLTAICAGQVRYYFGPHLESYNAQIRFERDGEDAIFRSLHFPAGTQVHLVDRVLLWTFNITTMLDFWDADLQVGVVYPGDLTDEYLAALPRDVDHAFFIDPDDHAVLARLQAHFSLEPPQVSPYNVPQYKQFVLYYAPAAQP